MNVTASNMANADSVAGPDGETYRAKQVMFETQAQNNRYGVGAADDEGYVAKPNVEPVNEMVNMISASRSYQANVEVFNTTKQMMVQTLSLGEG